MRLRATKIEHTFGRFGTFGCFSRAIDAVTCAPHQCRQGLPLCRAGVPRWVGQERREIGDMAPYRGLLGPNVARLLRSRREDTRIRFSVSGLSMRAADSRARSSSSWAYR